MTELIPKLVRGDVVEWPDGERAKVGERFRVEGVPTLLRGPDDFRVISVRVKLPDGVRPRGFLRTADPALTRNMGPGSIDLIGGVCRGVSIPVSSQGARLFTARNP
jgi:hypothetical protein